MCVERVVSNCELMLAEIQSKQVDGGCEQLRVRWLDGNAFLSLTSVQIAHSS